LGNVWLDFESREAATERLKVTLIAVMAVAPSGLDHFSCSGPKTRKASPWA